MEKKNLQEQFMDSFCTILKEAGADVYEGLEALAGAFASILLNTGAVTGNDPKTFALSLIDQLREQVAAVEDKHSNK